MIFVILPTSIEILRPRKISLKSIQEIGRYQGHTQTHTKTFFVIYKFFFISRAITRVFWNLKSVKDP